TVPSITSPSRRPSKSSCVAASGRRKETVEDWRRKPETGCDLISREGTSIVAGCAVLSSAMCICSCVQFPFSEYPPIHSDASFVCDGASRDAAMNATTVKQARLMIVVIQPLQPRYAPIETLRVRRASASDRGLPRFETREENLDFLRQHISEGKAPPRVKPSLNGRSPQVLHYFGCQRRRD